MPNPFSPKGRKKSEIKRSPKPECVEQPTGEARKVGLKPQKDWHKRNFFTEVLIPSLFAKRAGQHEKPAFPALQNGEIGVTWIGHASFLIQTEGHNLLIDPNWARWLKVIKRSSSSERARARVASTDAAAASAFESTRLRY